MTSFIDETFSTANFFVNSDDDVFQSLDLELSSSNEKVRREQLGNTFRRLVNRGLHAVGLGDGPCALVTLVKAIRVGL